MGVACPLSWAAGNRQGTFSLGLGCGAGWVRISADGEERNSEERNLDECLRGARGARGAQAQEVG